MLIYKLFILITSPGVIMHELAHAFFCLFTGTKVFKIKLFQFGNPAGYVNHAQPNKFWKACLISFGPLIVNSLISLFLFALVKPIIFNWWILVYFWLALSIGLHAIPSSEDAKSLLKVANRRFWRNPLVIVSYPFILLLYILNLLRRFKIHIIYVGVLFYLAVFYL